MKKQILFLLVVALLMSCKSTGGNISSFKDVLGKELKLIEVQINSTPFERIVLYDRKDLTKNKVGNIYTVNFSSDTVSGTGAPNKYSAPYTAGDNNTLTISLIRSTLMAPIVQPEKLQETDFYNYMQKVGSWSAENGKLVLHSKTDSGIAVRLIFTL
jgi:heat shock protein HslJ